MNQLEITRGDTRVFSSKVMTVDKALAGATVRAMFRKVVGGAVVISKATGGLGIVVTSDVPDNRAFSITFLPADTSALSVKGERLFYDVEIVYADSYVATTEEGVLMVKGDWTYT